jgi:membrane-bound lytic murein transglycosylase D
VNTTRVPAKLIGLFLLAIQLSACGALWNPGQSASGARSVALDQMVKAPLEPVLEGHLAPYLLKARWHLLRAAEEEANGFFDQAQQDLDQAFAMLSEAEIKLGKLDENVDPAVLSPLRLAVESAYLDLLPHIENFSPDNPLSILLQGLSDEKIEELAPDAAPLVRIHQLGMRADVPIDANPKVAASIRFFQTRGQTTYAIWLKRAGRYQELILKILEEEGVPRDLFYLAMIESGFNTRALSRARAKGLWQFIASTARLEGLEITHWLDERQDPVKATRAAARHLKRLHEEFGDWRLAAAAYNAGMGRVQRAIEKAGTRDFWQLQLPSETRNYLPLFMAAVVIGQEPRLFGFEPVEPEPPMRFEEVKIKQFISLKAAAGHMGISYNQMRDLNPELRQRVTPPQGKKTYVLRIPPGKAESFRRWYDQMPVTDIPKLLRYEIQRGDNLHSIAQDFGVTATLIADANDITNPNRIRAGQKIYIPTVGAASGSAEAYTVHRGDVLGRIARNFEVSVAQLKEWNGLDDDLIKSGQTLRIRRRGSGRRQTPVVAPVDKPQVYTVRRGDVLGRIARNFGVSVTQLKEWNGLGDDLIKPGQTLHIHRYSNGNHTTPSVASSSEAEAYTVRRGDALGRIAQNFGVSVTQLKEWNGLGDDLIKPGQTLYIRGTAANRLHTVKNGDTLWTIARHFGVTVGDLQSWNQLSGSSIRPGQQLVVLGLAAQTRFYTVEKNDTLFSIARRHGLAPGELARQNNINLKTKLMAGTTLKIPSLNSLNPID